MRVSLVLGIAATATAQAACPPVELVYARATTEPPQNAGTGQLFENAANRVWSKGYGAAGHSLYTNITALIPGSTGYPVHYPASFNGCSSENPGIQDMTNHLKTKAAACPDTKFVLGGHSQGGFVTARTVVRLPKDIKDKILAVTMFGSPDCKYLGLEGRCRSYCYHRDEVCDDPKSAKSKGKCADNLLSDLTGGGKGKGINRWMTGEFVQEQASVAQGEQADGNWANALAESPSPAECLKGSQIGAKEERGLEVRGQSHLQYNSDGRYIREAACFVYRKYAAIQGTGGAKV